jgi:hypothetical protein
MIQPKAKPKQKLKTTPQPVPASPQPPDDTSKRIQALHDENVALTQEIAQLKEAALFSKKRLSDMEQEHNDASRRLAENEGALVEAKKTIDSCCHTIQIVTCEIDRLTGQIEQERHQHSVEIRALLRKADEETTTESGKKKARGAAAALPKMLMPPLPSLLLLLAACQKGIDLHSAPDWPDNEHRLLVRRKFFDVAKKMSSTPFAIVSLEQPTEYFMSPKLPVGVSINDLRAIVLSYKEAVGRLKQYEPYHFTDEKLGGRWVAFRAAWSNLDDLIALAPA